MSVLAFFALASAPAAPMAALRTELAAACRLTERALSGSDFVGYVRMLIGPSNGVCRRDARLALRLARAVAEAPDPGSGEAYWMLSILYEGGHGFGRNLDLSRLYQRRAWLLGTRLATPPRSPVEVLAFLTDADSIDFLRGRIARGAPPAERVRLAEALLARKADGDLAEARTLLRTDSVSADPSAPPILARAALEPGATPADVAGAAARLRPAGPSGGPDVRALLLRLARLQLANAGTPRERWDAVESLAAAAYAGEPEALDAFRQALNAANGDREPATVGAATLPLRIDGQDYPASALRHGISGTVRLRALVDPLGRTIFTEAVGEPQPAALVETVRRIHAHRGAALPAGALPRPTSYVWVEIPPVSFRLCE